MKSIIIILLLSLAGAVVFLSIVSHFIVAVKNQTAEKRLESIYQKDYFTVKEIKNDLIWYEDMLNRVHPREIPQFPIGNVKEKIKKLKSTIDRPVTRLEFFKLFAPIVSMINDEHTTILLPKYELEQCAVKDGKVFPFNIVFIDGHMYIKDNLSANKTIRNGMEIISINSISAADIRDKLMLWFSGSRDAQKIFYLQQYFKEALFIEFGSLENFNLELQTFKDKEIIKIMVSGRAISGKKMRPFYYEVIDSNMMLFTYNLFQDPENTFKNFLKEMFRTIQEKNIKNLIIDLRQNKGGNTFLGDILLSYIAVKPFRQFSRMDVLISEEARKGFLSQAPGFIRWFPIQYFHPMLKPLWEKDPGEIISVTMEDITPKKKSLHFQGNVYVITGPGSMSSATLLPSTIKKYKLGVLVGENTGGLDTMYGNVTIYRLPNTGLEIEMPCGILYGNSFGTVKPDIPIKQTVKHLMENKDTIIEYIKKGVAHDN